jgi:regulator of replication initiation timing
LKPRDNLELEEELAKMRKVVNEMGEENRQLKVEVEKQKKRVKYTV